MKRFGKNRPKQDEVSRKYRVNEQIRAKQVRLIGSDGSQIGIVTKQKALTTAQEEGLDLIEIAAKARPPVCKIGDFGKMRYDLSKKLKQQKKNQNNQITKTVQFKPNIGESDLLRKIDHIQKFLDKGYRVVVQVNMKGRQNKFANLAEANTINKIQENLVDAVMDKPSKQGSRITVTISKAVAKEEAP